MQNGFHDLVLAPSVDAAKADVQLQRLRASGGGISDQDDQGAELQI